MQESSQNVNAGSDDSDITLDAPRFDADEARRAHPVVPLNEVRAPRNRRAGFLRSGTGIRRHRSLSLIVLALFGVTVLGVVGTKVLRRNNNDATPSSIPADAAQTQTQPTQTPQENSMPPNTTPARSQALAREKASPASSIAIADKSEASASPRMRESRTDSIERRTDATAPREYARDRRREFEGEDVEHHGRWHDDREARDERQTRDDDRDSRRFSRHLKRGEARLVDVLVGPSRP